MYRQRIAEDDGNDDGQFVTRLYGLPVITSAMGQLSALYTGTKERNRLFRFTLETAESGFGIAVRTARPIASKFEKPIGSLNDIACQQLVKFEHDYPIITKSTDEVLQVTKDVCTTAVKPLTDRVGSALATVKPISDRVGAVGHYSFDKVNGVKIYAFDTIDGVRTYSVGKIQDARSYGASKIEGARSYGASKIEDARTYGVNKLTSVTDFGVKSAGRILDNQAGRAVVERMDKVVQLADHYVDQYLPGDEDVADADTKKPVDRGDEQEFNGHTILTTRAVDFSYKVGRRSYAHVSKRLKNLKLRSLETVNKLNFTVDLMEYARSNLNGVKTKAETVWEEINKSADEAAEEITENEKVKMNLTYERRAIATARQLTQRLKANLSGVHLSMDMLPNVVRNSIDRAFNLTQSLFLTFSSRNPLSTADIDGVKSSIGHLRHALLSIKAWIPSALTPAFTRLVGADDESQQPTEEAKTGDQEEEKHEDQTDNNSGENQEQAAHHDDQAPDQQD